MLPENFQVHVKSSSSIVSYIVICFQVLYVICNLNKDVWEETSSRCTRSWQARKISTTHSFSHWHLLFTTRGDTTCNCTSREAASDLDRSTSVREQSTTGTVFLSQSWTDATSVNSFKNWLDKYWTDMGISSFRFTSSSTYKYLDSFQCGPRHWQVVLRWSGVTEQMARELWALIQA